MTDPVVSIATLPELLPGRHLLEGQDFGLGHLRLVLGESPPGQVAPLHRHDYEEIFIIHAGRGTYTLGETTVEAGPGEVVIIPGSVPHRFANHGEESLHHTAVHATGIFVLEVLEG
jgi:mannose-6-phosphate isomerase-like protein (cupin superfamily)